MSGTHKASANLDNKLKLGLVLNTVFTIFEFFIGITSGSLALISDAGHNLTDSLSLLIAFFAQKMAKKEANADHSYGFGRATILAALLNGTILVLLAIYIFYEAFIRIMHPEPVSGNLVIVVAFVGIIINGSIAFIFRKNTDDINIKAAYVNMFYDMLASVGALLAGFLIIITKQNVFDSLISILIGVLLLKSSWGIIQDALHVLLEGVPIGVSPEKIKDIILQSPGVKNVDDLHIWSISSHSAALSCHIVIDDCDVQESIKTIKQIKEELKDKFYIEHATIETELTECLPEIKQLNS